MDNRSLEYKGEDVEVVEYYDRQPATVRDLSAPGTQPFPKEVDRMVQAYTST